jgi:hypothetical protein
MRTVTRLATRWAAIAILSLSQTAIAQKPADPVEQRGLQIRDHFIAAIKKCGATPSFVPGVVVQTNPGLVSFVASDRSVHLSRWEELPPPLQGLVTAWAKQGTLGLAPKEMFGEIFNSLLVAHEMGHYLETLSHRLRTLDHWTAETEADEIAIAFWTMDKGSEAPIADRVANFDTFLGSLPSPVPAGADPHAYFEKNYDALSDNAAAYGWYQGAFTRAAWAARGQRTFCDWVKIAPFAPASDFQ